MEWTFDERAGRISMNHGIALANALMTR